MTATFSRRYKSEWAARSPGHIPKWRAVAEAVVLVRVVVVDTVLVLAVVCSAPAMHTTLPRRAVGEVGICHEISNVPCQQAGVR